MGIVAAAAADRPCIFYILFFRVVDIDRTLSQCVRVRPGLRVLNYFNVGPDRFFEGRAARIFIPYKDARRPVYCDA